MIPSDLTYEEVGTLLIAAGHDMADNNVMLDAAIGACDHQARAERLVQELGCSRERALSLVSMTPAEVIEAANSLLQAS